MSTTLEYAGAYLGNGWLPHPLVPGKKIPARPWKHLVELVPPFEMDAVAAPWRYQDYGVGILLQPSGLLVVDCDSVGAVQEAIENTPEGCNNLVRTSKGLHMYFKRPPDCPICCIVQRGTSGKIDIKTDGYVVAPPTLHPSGVSYQWLSAGELQPAPEWATAMLSLIRARSYTASGVDPSSQAPTQLSEEQSWELFVRDRRVFHYMSGQIRPEDRSRAIWLTVNTLIRLKYDDATIANLLWYSAPLNEKPRERGIAWLGDEIARARLEITPD